MTKYILVLGFVMELCLACAWADHYAAKNGQTPAGPYTSWETAAINIQDAVNAADTNDVVWVGAGRYAIPTNGVVYNTITNVVYIYKPLTLRSSNGVPAGVIIDGAGTNRGINVYHNTSTTNRFVVSGLTVSNSNDKGILFYATSAGISWTGIVENCVVVDGKSGDGIYDYHNNTARTIIISNSVIRNNAGAGITSYSEATDNNRTMITDSILENNLSAGLSFQSGIHTISRCIIRGNSGRGLSIGAGTYYMYNCLVCNNVAAGIGGAIYKWSATGPLYIYNCTIVSNLSSTDTGGIRSAAVNPIVHSIIYNNSGSPADIYTYGGTAISNCCTSSTNRLSGPGNITNQPAFVDFAGQNFRLTQNSPCVNRGLNQSWMEGAKDFDNHSRIDVFSGRVDMGCYEYLPRGMTFKTR